MQDWSLKVLKLHETLIKKVSPKVGKFDEDDFSFGQQDMFMGGGAGMPGQMMRYF